MSKVKICGITNLEDALIACEAGADAVGFVFAAEAKARNRYIDPDAAQQIVEQLPPLVTSVAVCVNEAPERVREYLSFVDRVQLCGEESPGYCGEFAACAIKAFRTSPDFDPAAMLEYKAQAYLLDASCGAAHGGTGVTCDWDAAQQAVKLGRPLILAGGLHPGNVAEAVHRVQPYAVDVSTGVESSPGKKDHDKIRRFIHNARALSLS